MPETPINSQEEASFWVKTGLYVLGSILGIGAKLATMRRTKEVTMTDALIELLIASAASFLVWSFFHFKLKQDELAIVASVIVGRYGDNILIAVFARIDAWVTKLNGKQ